MDKLDDRLNITLAGGSGVFDTGAQIQYYAEIRFVEKIFRQSRKDRQDATTS
jgi:hypothetical protein